MVGKMDPPVSLGYRLYALLDLSLCGYALTILIPSKDIIARIGRIPDQTEYAFVAQAPPDESACPGTAIGTLRKAQALFGKSLDDGICAAGFLKQMKHQLHGAAYLVIGIPDDATVIVIAQADGQWKAQLTLLCLVEFAALEAPAQEM